MSLWIKRMRFHLLLSGDTSICFCTCLRQGPFCLIYHVNYFKTRLFSEHIFSL